MMCEPMCDCYQCAERRELEELDAYRERYSSFETQLLARNFTYMSRGSFRRVYQRKNIVIKIPLKHDGLIDNRVEAAAWNKYKNNPTSEGLFLAPCRLLANDCLMMVVVSLLPYDYQRPEWIEKIDSLQVGLHRGRLVAYDYALDRRERHQWEKEWGIRSNFFHQEWIQHHAHAREVA